MSHEIPKTLGIGAGAALFLLGASRLIDILPTHYVRENAKDQLQEFPDCESGLLPVEVESSSSEPAGIYDFSCGESKIPLLVKGDGGMLYVDWASTEAHLEEIAYQGYFTNLTSDEERSLKVATPLIFGLTTAVAGISRFLVRKNKEK